MNQLKITVDNAIKELEQLGRLTEILAAAAAVRASIDVLEKNVNNLCLLLVPKVGVPQSQKKTKKQPTKVKVDIRKDAPARDDVKKRIIAKLHKEQRAMSQAELIRVLHHDYYSVAAALKELRAAGGIKEESVLLPGLSGAPTKRAVKGYALA